MKLSLRRLVFLACVLGAAGCGSGEVRHPVYKAGGKVTLADGSPLAGGRIEFQPVEPAGSNKMPSAKGQLSSDGTFVLQTYKADDGAVEGEHRVLVIGPEAMKPGAAPPAAVDSKYWTFENSGLKFTVTRDPMKNQFEVKLP